MTNTKVAFPLGLEAKARWTNLERKVVFLELVTRLHSPDSATRRRGIRAKLYDELLVEMSAVRTKSARQQAMQEYLEGYCESTGRACCGARPFAPTGGASALVRIQM